MRTFISAAPCESLRGGRRWRRSRQAALWLPVMHERALTSNNGDRAPTPNSGGASKLAKPPPRMMRMSAQNGELTPTPLLDRIQRPQDLHAMSCVRRAR